MWRSGREPGPAAAPGRWGGPAPPRAKIRAMPALHSVCPLDCPDRCSLEVRVEDGRVTSITGSRVHPLTDGFICAKVRDFPQIVYGPDRLLHPMRRTGPKRSGTFEP